MRDFRTKGKSRSTGLAGAEAIDFEERMEPEVKRAAQYFRGCLLLFRCRCLRVSITMKMNTRNPNANKTITPGLFSQICLTPFVSWDQFILRQNIPFQAKNKLRKRRRRGVREIKKSGSTRSRSDCHSQSHYGTHFTEPGFSGNGVKPAYPRHAMESISVSAGTAAPDSSEATDAISGCGSKSGDDTA